MKRLRASGEQIRQFIISKIEDHPRDISRLAVEKFSITRQAVHRHLRQLVTEGLIAAEGRTRSISYRLCPLRTWIQSFPIQPGLTEDFVWRELVAPNLAPLPGNVVEIWHYAFTEVFNNAIDHSNGSLITVWIEQTAAATRLSVRDDGVGIFRKIQGALDLADERHAVLELAKGKFTTDPSRHSGEGIFFASRMLEEFVILSGEVYFSHSLEKPEDWILERSSPSHDTYVAMKLSNHTSRTAKQVFDRFASGDDYGFTRTVVPVRLALYGDENLISRSQARRLLTRFERFKTVVLDFTGVSEIGQAFADEVFRVFRKLQPGVDIVPIHCSSAVMRMIRRAETHEGP